MGPLVGDGSIALAGGGRARAWRGMFDFDPSGGRRGEEKLSRRDFTIRPLRYRLISRPEAGGGGGLEGDGTFPIPPLLLVSFPVSFGSLGEADICSRTYGS